MTDYVKITVRVKGGRYTLKNKKNGREKRKKFDFFHRPEELQGRIERVVELAYEDTIFDTTEKIKEIYIKDFKKYLSEWYEEKYDIEGELEWIISVEVASEQNVKWCIENLTVSQIINMGLNVINIKE